MLRVVDYKIEHGFMYPDPRIPGLLNLQLRSRSVYVSIQTYKMKLDITAYTDSNMVGKRSLGSKVGT